MSPSDTQLIWRVVTVYSDGKRDPESRWMTKGAAELLAEDIRHYRDANPDPGYEGSRIEIEKVSTR